MAKPIFDVSHLSPAERIRLAEELWDSLEPEQVPVSADLARKLDERLRQYRDAPERARPAEDVLKELEERGR
jgi:putative addiction module component (TIGR02574 family)